MRLYISDLGRPDEGPSSQAFAEAARRSNMEESHVMPAIPDPRCQCLQDLVHSLALRWRSRLRPCLSRACLLAVFSLAQADEEELFMKANLKEFMPQAFVSCWHARCHCKFAQGCSAPFYCNSVASCSFWDNRAEPRWCGWRIVCQGRPFRSFQSLWICKPRLQERLFSGAMAEGQRLPQMASLSIFP